MSDLFEKFFEIISSNTQINKNDMYLFGIPKVSSNNKKTYSALDSLNTQNFDLKQVNILVNKLYDL